MAERERMIDALGGEAGCLQLATSFYAHVAQDPVLKPLFPGKTMRCATEEFSAFLVQFLGGDEAHTQDRWWLGLRESHARFKISEAQRDAWLNQMKHAIWSLPLDSKTQDALFQFFVSTSAPIVNLPAEPVETPELAARWERQKALDTLVADLIAGRDGEVLRNLKAFADRPSLFVGILARMLQVGRPALVAAVSAIVERDPSLSSRQSAGRTLLHYAAGAGRVETVAQLLHLGVDPNVLDRGGHPPLYRVANECGTDAGPEIVRLLVQAGANPNHVGGVTRATPLHMAARRGHLEIARALLAAGASPLIRDTKKHTPFDRAVNCRQPEVAELMRRIS